MDDNTTVDASGHGAIASTSGSASATVASDISANSVSASAAGSATSTGSATVVSGIGTIPSASASSVGSGPLPNAASIMSSDDAFRATVTQLTSQFGPTVGFSAMASGASVGIGTAAGLVGIGHAMPESVASQFHFAEHPWADPGAAAVSTAAGIFQKRPRGAQGEVGDFLKETGCIEGTVMAQILFRLWGAIQDNSHSLAPQLLGISGMPQTVAATIYGAANAQFIDPLREGLRNLGGMLREFQTFVESWGKMGKSDQAAAALDAFEMSQQLHAAIATFGMTVGDSLENMEKFVEAQVGQFMIGLAAGSATVDVQAAVGAAVLAGPQMVVQSVRSYSGPEEAMGSVPVFGTVGGKPADHDPVDVAMHTD